MLGEPRLVSAMPTVPLRDPRVVALDNPLLRLLAGDPSPRQPGWEDRARLEALTAAVAEVTGHVVTIHPSLFRSLN